MKWIAFLEQHRITYDTRGKNVSGNHVAIHCPFCGAADPSRHLVINLDGAGWHCWRRREHRGRSSARLIRELLHCTTEQARLIAGDDRTPIPDNLAEVVKDMLASEKTPGDPTLSLPGEFRPFKGQYTSKRFCQYLRGRYFTTLIEKLAEDYDLRYAVTGDFHGRVIFLVHSIAGELVGWTGRSIYANEKLRYKTEGPLGHYLLWDDKLPRPDSRFLFLCEGPMDALKINVLGRGMGIDATCCFTSAPTKRQTDLLYSLCPRYDQCYVLLDRGEVTNTLWTTGALAPLWIKPLWLTDHKDPAEFRTSDELMALIKVASPLERV